MSALTVADECRCGGKFLVKSEWAPQVDRRHTDWLRAHAVCRGLSDAQIDAIVQKACEIWDSELRDGFDGTVRAALVTMRNRGETTCSSS